MKKLILLLIIGSFLTLFTSCESEDVSPSGPSLTVYVEGAISGIARNNVKVTLYTSQFDADNEVSQVTYDYSNSSGNTYFSGLRYTTYWARANTILGTVREIESITIIYTDNNLTLNVL